MAKKPAAPVTPARSIQNKKARYRYLVLERLEVGIVLQGTEVKSLRRGRASLDEAFARVVNDEMLLFGCHIDPYEHGNRNNHEPARARKLLLHRREIKRLVPKVTQKGQTLVPLSIYFNDRGLAKVNLGLVNGKTQSDKREDLKKRDQTRDMARAMSRDY